jgi:hypothetical protein
MTGLVKICHKWIPGQSHQHTTRVIATAAGHNDLRKAISAPRYQTPFSDDPL